MEKLLIGSEREKERARDGGKRVLCRNLKLGGGREGSRCSGGKGVGGRKGRGRGRKGET